jgi:hypothetical protein
MTSRRQHDSAVLLGWAAAGAALAVLIVVLWIGAVT